MIPNSILIFTDGASKGNPGPGGYGAIIVCDDKVTELGGREEYATNNRMELTAAIEALSFLKSSQLEAHSLKLFSDSSYLVNGITKWIYGWQKNGWKTQNKQPIENRDLWGKLFSLSNGKNIMWRQIAGHSGHEANERCDEIATSFADNETTRLYSGPISGYKINISGKGKPVSKNKGKKAYSYISLVNGVIQIHETWEECKNRVSGKSGSRYKKALSAEDEKLIVDEYSNQG